MTCMPALIVGARPSTMTRTMTSVRSMTLLVGRTHARSRHAEDDPGR